MSDQDAAAYHEQRQQIGTIGWLQSYEQAAALGNTVGGMTCYYMGRLGKISWIEKYFKVKKEKVDKMVNFLQGKGALMAFFAFLPAIGEVISIALGFMRSNIWLTVASMFAGKLIRYILLLYVLESAWNVVAG